MLQHRLEREFFRVRAGCRDFRNRFFKVKALVKATDYQHRNPNNTVLVAKAIKFVQEITEASETLTAKRNSVHR
jgi:hypothetical protein